MQSKNDKKCLVLVDDSNLYYGFKKQRWELDYEKFYRWLYTTFSPIAVYYFGGIISKKTFFDRHPGHTLGGFVKYKNEREAFFRMLKHVGYSVRTKPVSSVYDSMAGQYKRKCNFDVEMTVLAIDKMPEYEALVLCSGDGDFVKLLKYVKGKYKKAVVMAHKDRLHWQVEKTANRVIFFEDIRQDIEKKKGLP